jgi:hypothetical protein
MNKPLTHSNQYKSFYLLWPEDNKVIFNMEETLKSNEQFKLFTDNLDDIIYQIFKYLKKIYKNYDDYKFRQIDVGKTLVSFKIFSGTLSQFKKNQNIEILSVVVVDGKILTASQNIINVPITT